MAIKLKGIKKIALTVVIESKAGPVQEKEILIFSYLAGNGPALWWIKEDGDKVYRNIIIQALSRPNSFVKQAAVVAFGEFSTNEDLPDVKQMLKDVDGMVRTAAVRVFGKLGTHEDLPDVKQMLKDTDSNVKQAAVKVFGKLEFLQIVH